MTLLNQRNSSLMMAAGFALAPLMACATTQPPQELVEARAAYTRAERGYARELSPASLHSAKVALDGAERKFEDDGASTETRDQSYIALRKAELADADGATAHYQRELASTKDRASSEQAHAAQRTAAELEQAKQQLAAEAAARQAAEQRTKDALDRLAAANSANVKQEERGTVITLSGNVLFASGKSDLLPGAQSSLNQVADALKDQSDKNILVEGHTDSTGSAALNTQLSQARAQSVATYLISRGLPREQVTPQGFGPSRPVADNATPEGRANNRRVEIVIQAGEKR
jgi:outer membrane protein OmpA-like peptidoglycan-associated protein